MKSERVKDFLWGLGFVFLQIIIFRHLKIFKIQADIVFIYVLWIMFQRAEPQLSSWQRRWASFRMP